MLATFVKPWESRRRNLGGLFGAPLSDSDDVLSWNRTQQAAFLMVVGTFLRDRLRDIEVEWAVQVRNLQARIAEETNDPLAPDLAPFAGQYTLLTTDQGIRGLLHIANDLFYLNAKTLELSSWSVAVESATPNEASIREAISSFNDLEPAVQFLAELSEQLASFDWRTIRFPDLTEEERANKSRYRGSGGYRQLREDLLRHIARAPSDIGNAAQSVIEILDY